MDLEIDVVRWADGRVAVIDQKELEDGFKAGYISGKMRDEARRIANEIKAVAESEELKAV